MCVAGVPTSSFQVTIVATNGETLDDLQEYLSLAGVEARASRTLPGAGMHPCSAIILFPDGFAPDDVLSELARLHRDQPGVLPLVVTGEPKRYEQVVRPETNGRPPIVIPRPAWGWTILDAIREGMRSELGR